jgi:cytochrome P450
MSEAVVLEENINDIPIDQIAPGDPTRFQQDTIFPMFERVRNEDPVHYTADSPWGAYWSITKFEDIIAIDKDHVNFSSETGGIVLGDPEEDFDIPNFISMDPPKHDEQRKTVTGIVAPRNLAEMETLIRTRVCTILDSLPIGEEFNWVDKVSIELTTQMLATLFDFPFEDRRKLTFWSDMATASPLVGDTNVTKEERETALLECLEYFTRLFNERKAKEPGETLDLITMLAHGESTKDMDPMEFLGNLVLLIVGGNDTTRNSISGGVLALNQNPDEYQKLRENPALIPSMVSEIVRWQTPLAYMRRTAVNDIEFKGKQIKAGDRVIMWYVSGNRDETAIENADKFIIDRATPRHHLSFGFGIHRCMGNRLAEMQLKILWEEILQRYEKVELIGKETRNLSNFVRGITDLPVVLHAKK